MFFATVAPPCVTESGHRDVRERATGGRPYIIVRGKQKNCGAALGKFAGNAVTVGGSGRGGAPRGRRLSSHARIFHRKDREEPTNTAPLRVAIPLFGAKRNGKCPRASGGTSAASTHFSGGAW